MKLSVIVPVYNTEEYLRQSIESILQQTYKDIEVILVDDGSTDGSGKICDEYAAAYDNFKVIHQENSGNVAARCRGAEEAVGEYVTFMDSDDWIAENMYEELMKTAEMEECDIVSLKGYTAYNDGKYYQVEASAMNGIYEREKNLDIFLSKMMYDEEKECVGIGPSLWSKVIKKKIVSDVMEKVNKNIALGGDAAIFYPCCLRAKRVCIIEGYQYFYRIREMSVSHYYDITYFNKIYIWYKYLESDFLNFDKRYYLLEQLRKHLWHFLEMQIKQVFSLELKRVYLFPYQLISKGSKIILYGAGKVGQSYNEQIRTNGYCDIVAWVDSNAYKENENIISPMEIVGLEYSQVVIAIKNQESAEEIIQNLIGLGVDKEKIMWAEPSMMSLV